MTTALSQLKWLACAAMLAGAIALPARAGDFSFTFEWGGIPRCTTGYPNVVPNPVFHVSSVPAGTRMIAFRLTDLDAPGYRHGGGQVAFDGKHKTFAPGAFTYKSPCPPSGRHTYEWHATALDGAGHVLATAMARQKYP